MGIFFILLVLFAILYKVVDKGSLLRKIVSVAIVIVLVLSIAYLCFDFYYTFLV